MRPTDYLAAGAQIIERLRTEVRALRGVLPAEDLAALSETTIGPIAFVIYDGDEVFDGAGRAQQGASQRVRQRWLVVIAVRHAGQTRQAATHEAAGPLLSSVIGALAGWPCAPFSKPLIRVTAPRVNYGPNFALYPLMFAGDF